jgi:hypothetical protein
MSVIDRLHYYRRIFPAYIAGEQSQLTFWHEQPEANPRATFSELGEYYMEFARKADYSSHLDPGGIPLLDYHGRIGLQYNPIAIAQWGLGNYNRYFRDAEEKHLRKWCSASDWLVARLEKNLHGLWTWNHHFDWEYRSKLKAPWYSALAQAQGISLLVRAYRETAQDKYLEAADRAFRSFLHSTDEGGVTFRDESGNLWFEEYIVAPPSHILNGFIWAAWGVYDFFLATKQDTARSLFEAAVHTLKMNLAKYDLGFWSLYEQSGTILPMVASHFYHRLHIVQLQILHRMTGIVEFREFADRWEAYSRQPMKRTRALWYKSAFKLCYY